MHYVGQHRGSMPDLRYFGSGFLLCKMINKYGIKDRVFRRIVCYRSNQKTLNSAEIRFIREAKELWGRNCLNRAHGGDLPGLHSKETRERMSASRIAYFKTEEGKAAGYAMSAQKSGVPLSESHRKSISSATRGKKKTEEHKARISLGLTGIACSEDKKSKISKSNTGKRLTQEQKAIKSANQLEFYRTDAGKEVMRKRSEKMTGRKASDAHRAAISRALTGKKRSAIQRANQSASLKNQPVVTCPHCMKVGSQGAMRRWHFDNCRLQ